LELNATIRRIESREAAIFHDENTSMLKKDTLDSRVITLTARLKELQE